MGIDVAALRGDANGLVMYFMRAANCPVCVRHVKTLAGMGLAARGIAAVVVVPGGTAEVERVRRVAGTVPVTSSDGVAAHHAAGLDKTLLLQHSGTLLFDAKGQELYRLVTTMPHGSLNPAALTAAVERLQSSEGRNGSSVRLRPGRG